MPISWFSSDGELFFLLKVKKGRIEAFFFFAHSIAKQAFLSYYMVLGQEDFDTNAEACRQNVLVDLFSHGLVDGWCKASNRFCCR